MTEARPDTPTCETCRNWRPTEGVLGECRRHAPLPVLTWRRAEWPLTCGGDYCGEWCPRPCRPQASAATALREAADAVEALTPVGDYDYCDILRDGFGKVVDLLRRRAAEIDGTAG